MSSFVRTIQRKQLRIGKKGVLGRWLGQHNSKAPKPNSLPARGSRRGTHKNPWRSQAA